MQLREHWVAIDALVDTAVDTHYSGFNKSLQNYSQILRLFSESMAHLAVLRRTLEAAQIRLHPEPARIKELYRRELMLSDVQRLLEDIQAAVTVPEKVRRLQRQGEWSLAVTTLLDGCNKVAREELLGVGALRTLRDDLSQLRESLLATLTAEIERCVYDSHGSFNHRNTRGLGGGGGGGGMFNTPPRTILKNSILGDGGSISASGSMTMPRLRRHGSSYLESPMNSGVLQPDASPMRRPTHRRAATYGAAGTAGFGSFSGLGTIRSAGGFIMSGDGHFVDSEVSLTTLVSCVAQLGGVQAALRSLRSHMPSKIRAIIAEVLDSFPRSQWLAEEGRQTTVTAGQRKRDAATATTTSTITEAISSRCLKTLHSLARVLQLLAMSRPPATTAGLQMLLGSSNTAAVTPEKNSNNNIPAPPSSSSSPRAADSPFNPHSDSMQIKDPVSTALQECRFAWESIQFECQVLVASIIGAPVPFGKSRRVLLSPDLPGGGWLASVGALEAEDSGDGTFTEDTVGLGAGGGGGAGGSADATQGGSAAIMFSLAEEATTSLVPTTTLLSSGELTSSTTTTSAAAATSTIGTLTTSDTTTIAMQSKDNHSAEAVGVVAGSAASAPVTVTEADLATMVSSILGSRQGRPELVAAVYKPMIALVDEAERLLDEVSHGSGDNNNNNTNARSGQQSPSAATTPTGAGPRFSALLHNMPAIPWKLGGLGGPLASSPSSGGGGSASESILRSFIDNFSRMEFLPAAYVTTRARCRGLLEAGDALRPRVRLRGSYRPGAAVLPAATGAVEMAEEVLSWAANAPPFATHLAGVLENVLARVLEAFQDAIASTVGTGTAGKLADDVRVVQIMAKEPAAPLLGPPVSFFIGANADAIDSFVSSAIAAGFGSSQKGLERELVARILTDPKKSSPSSTLFSVRPESLLADAGEAGRLIQVACLAESADHVADAIHAAAAAAAFQAGNNKSMHGGGAGGGNPRRGDAWRRHGQGTTADQGQSSTTTTSSGMDRGFAEGIAHAADRYRAFAGKCIRALRLELILLAAHHLEALPRLAAGGATATAAEEHVASLARVVTQLDEALAPYLPPDRRMYIFGSLPPAVVALSVSMLPQFTSAIDTACVTRVCRVFSALQPVLCAAGGVGEGPLPVVGSGMPDPTRQLEKAKMYYSLLLQSPEALISTVASKPKRFSAEEYSALLNVNVVGRKVTAEHKQQLQNVLISASASAAPKP